MRFDWVFPFFAALAVAPSAFSQPRGPGEDEDIVVMGERPRGSVPGDIPPETTFSAADVRSYGASSVFQILAALAPQTGTASIRGGGAPIVLVNGRRISGLQEVRDLPPDVIARVEVFDEQLSLQYGYSPDQRVVNIVLEQRYSANAAEAGGGRAGSDARASQRLEASQTDINEGARNAFGIGYDAASSIAESERPIAPPASGVDDRAARTISPDATNWRANANLARAFNERVTGAASLRLEGGSQIALLGHDPSTSALRVRNTQTDVARVSGGLDGAYAGWQWTATATADHSRQERETEGGASPARTRSEQRLLDVTANANGAVFSLPAGRVRTALRLGAEQRHIDAVTDDANGEARTNLSRTTPSGRLTVSAPLTSRRREFGQAVGDISLNTTASWSHPSDFTALTGFGYGGSWSPTSSLRFSVQSEHGEAPPTLQQLGDPVLTTPDVPFFDAARGETVRVTHTNGGNSALGVESREDLTFNANWSPNSWLTLAFSWAHNDTSNFSAAPPFALLETEAAFPARYTRDINGALIAIDARPLNIARRDVASMRWGLSVSRSIGRAPQRSSETASPRPEEIAPSPGADATASPPEPRSRLGANAGRWNLSVYHRLRLVDDLSLSPGLAPIDLLDRGGLEGGGETASSIEFEGGVFYNGLGLRFNGGWSDGYSTPIASGGALDFSQRLTVNARAFVNFNARPEMLAAAPWLAGSRLGLGIENLTDSFAEVSDGSPVTPAAYQEGYRNPLGRVVQVSFRKQF